MSTSKKAKGIKREYNEIPPSDEASVNMGLRGNFPHSKHQIMEYLAQNISLDDPLFDMLCESDKFQSFVRNCLQSDFEKLSREEFTRYIIDANTKNEMSLIKQIGEFDGHFVVTCDLWYTLCGERYVCVMCHWTDDDWSLERHVIGFEPIGDLPTSAFEIYLKVIGVLHKFKLRHKVIAFSFDDTSFRENCMKNLSACGLKPVLEVLSHDRKCAYQIELCAQELVDGCAMVINPIRELIKWVRTMSNDKKLEFKSLCEKKGLKLRNFLLDCPNNWRSTYKLLDKAYSYRRVLTELYNDEMNQGCIEDSQWETVDSVKTLLREFHSTYIRIGEAYNASCHFVIRDWTAVAVTLNNYENDPLLGSVVRKIKIMWLEHFYELPDVYCIASVLDPRVRLDGLREYLATYYANMGVNYCVEEKMANCKDVFKQLYAYYGLIYKHEAEFASSLKKKQIKREGSIDDLDAYLMIHFDDICDDFDVLVWWERKEQDFPILYRMAKDVLCIPVATISPMTNHKASERILDEKYSKYQPDLLRACICKKDWDMAQEATQGDQFRHYKDDHWASLLSETDY